MEEDGTWWKRMGGHDNRLWERAAPLISTDPACIWLEMAPQAGREGCEVGTITR